MMLEVLLGKMKSGEIGTLAFNSIIITTFQNVDLSVGVNSTILSTYNDAYNFGVGVNSTILTTFERME